MTLLAENGTSLPEPRIRAASTSRPSRLLAGIYRDIGLAAVAFGLELPIDDLDAEIVASVKRGARYIYLMPKGPAAAAS